MVHNHERLREEKVGQPLTSCIQLCIQQYISIQSVLLISFCLPIYQLTYSFSPSRPEDRKEEEKHCYKLLAG